MEIPKTLKDEIWDYCRVNNISNIDEFTLKLIKQGFTIEKFGATPTTNERIVEKIIEKIVEVPVEKIIEVPIEIISTELTQDMKNYIELYKQCQDKLMESFNITELLKKQLEEEKNKKKNDLYGEN